MRFSYRIVRERGGVVAECLEVDAMGEGVTEIAAIAALRSSLEERMFRPDAVAPPPEESPCPIELVAARLEDCQPRRSLDLGGPGDVPTRG
jgi:hypothetical protein